MSERDTEGKRKKKKGRATRSLIGRLSTESATPKKVKFFYRNKLNPFWPSMGACGIDITAICNCTVRPPAQCALVSSFPPLSFPS